MYLNKALAYNAINIILFTFQKDMPHLTTIIINGTAFVDVGKIS